MTILTHFLAASAGAFIGVVIMALLAMASERRDVARVEAALWQIIRNMRLNTYHVGIRAILEEHGIEVPKDEVVW